LDEAGLPEDGHVLGDGGGGQVEELDQLAGAELAAAEGEDGANPGGVGEGCGDGYEVVHGGAMIR
jgi:hypothetical protein